MDGLVLRMVPPARGSEYETKRDGKAMLYFTFLK